MTAGRIAILIDGGFFLKRLPKLVSAQRCESPGKIVACIRHMCRNHIKILTGSNDNRPIDFGKSDVALERYALFDLLRKERKLALRLGKVTRDHDWTISPALTKKLLRMRQAIGALDRLGDIPADAAAINPVSLQVSSEEVRSLMVMRDLWHSLDGGSVSLGLRQKGVDMRIGIDISSLTLKKQVDTIILVAGDSDFVPAAKLARREGIEFILDPLWQQVNSDLFEHIDGLQSGLKRPGSAAPSVGAGTGAAGSTSPSSGQQEN